MFSVVGSDGFLSEFKQEFEFFLGGGREGHCRYPKRNSRHYRRVESKPREIDLALLADVFRLLHHVLAFSVALIQRAGGPTFCPCSRQRAPFYRGETK